MKESLTKKDAAFEKNVQVVMDMTGWKENDVVRKMKAASERLGITAYDYVKYSLYNVPEEKLGAKYVAIIKKNAQDRIEEAKLKAKSVAKVMAVTGWNYDFAEAKILEAKKRTGVAYTEYFFYHFYELDEKTQEEVFLASHSKKIKQRYDVNKESIAWTYDKGLTNEIFGEYLRRAWCINNKISKKEFVKKFKDCGKVIYKPIKGGGGRSVAAFAITPENAEELYDEISILPEGLVEEYIIQHPEMNKLCSSSVNSIRIATISSNSKPVTRDGAHMDVAYAALRIGGGSSVVDNFHSGGMAVAIDLDTGVVPTDAANMEGEFFKAHPVSGTVFKGFQVPYFKEALEMVREAMKKTGIEGYLGWDIAISENGPVLVEINHNPGAMLLTAPYIAEKRGMKYVMDKYLF